MTNLYQSATIYCIMETCDYCNRMVSMETDCYDIKLHMSCHEEWLDRRGSGRCVKCSKSLSETGVVADNGIEHKTCREFLGYKK